MSICDVCNTPVGSEAKRYSASQIETAVRAGFRPPEAAFELGAAFGMSQAEAEASWVQRALADTTDWLLCPSCASQAGQHLRHSQAKRQLPQAEKAVETPSVPTTPATSTYPASDALRMDHIVPPGEVVLEDNVLIFRRGRLSSETESLPLDSLRLAYLFFPTEFKWRPLRQSEYRYQYQNLDALSDDAFVELRAAISAQPGFLGGDFSFVLADFQGRVVTIRWKKMVDGGLELLDQLCRTRHARQERLTRWTEGRPSLTIGTSGASLRAAVSINAAGVAQGQSKFISWSELARIEMSQARSFTKVLYFRFIPHKDSRHKKIVAGVSPKQAEACLAELDFWQSHEEAAPQERATAAPAHAGPSETSTLATVSLAAGIATWSLLPLIGAAIALIAGHVARKQIRESGGTLGGKQRSTVGLALAYAQFGLIGLIVILATLLGPADDGAAVQDRPTATLDVRPILTATAEAAQATTAAQSVQATATAEAKQFSATTAARQATSIARATPTLSPTPLPALAPTWTPDVEQNPDRVVAAYHEALRARDFEKAASFFSNFSLTVFDTDRETVQTEFEKQDFNGWRLIDYQIKEIRRLDHQTALVRVFAKQRNSENGQPQTLDFYVGLRSEDGQWRLNLNGILYHTQLNMPAQTVNDITIQPTWITRYTNKLQLFFNVVNDTDRNVVWGDTKEKAAVFQFADQSQEVTFTEGYAVEAHANRPNVNVYVTGFFETYPSEVELLNWRWASQNSPSLPDRSGQMWSYTFSIPRN